MKNIIEWVIFTAVMTLIFSLMKKSKKKDLECNTGNILKLPLYVFFIGLIDFLLFFSIALFSNIFPNGTESALTTVLFITFSILGLLLVYMYFVEKYTYDENEIIYRKITFRKTKIEWKSIDSVNYSAGMQWFVIKCNNGEKGYFHVMLKGFKPFSKMILQNIPHNKMNHKTLETLDLISNGNVVGSM
ncbi:MAG: hypothetical protein ACTTGZ_05120 [Treponema sp.]